VSRLIHHRLEYDQVIVTYPSVASDASSPGGRSIMNAKVFLYTKRTASGLGDHMCRCGVSPLYLHKTFRTNRLVAAAGMVDIWGIILEKEREGQMS
jgi:hypothetical protein